MSIIGEMYDGNINPSEKYIKKGGDYEKLNKELIDRIEKFLTFLNEEERMLYEDIRGRIYELCYITEKESYIEGFCTGAQFISEITNYTKSNFI